MNRLFRTVKRALLVITVPRPRIWAIEFLALGAIVCCVSHRPAFASDDPILVILVFGSVALVVGELNKLHDRLELLESEAGRQVLDQRPIHSTFPN
jgi:hypothetical protein